MKTYYGVKYQYTERQTTKLENVKWKMQKHIGNVFKCAQSKNSNSSALKE